MPISRVFLGLSDPCLPLAARWLLAECGADLSEILVVTPGARAGRRLRELLIEASDSGGNAGTPLFPPRFLTLGGVPEALYVSEAPVADELITRLAWIAALRGASADLLGALVSQRPADDDFAAWNGLARECERLSAELAAARMDFATVVDRCRQHTDFCDAPRWEALLSLRVRHLATLADVGLEDRDRTREAALRDRMLGSDLRIILVGCLEVSPLVQEMLRTSGADVTVLVHAEESEAEGFDETGALRSAYWEQKKLTIPDEAIRIVDRPRDQAQCVLETIATFDGAFAAHEITVGVGDDNLIPVIERSLRLAGLPARAANGREMCESSPALLLAAVRDYLIDPSCDRFAALVRHPDLEGWLCGDGAEVHPELQHGKWLSALDRYTRDHIPYSPDGFSRESQAGALAADAYAAVTGVLTPLLGERRPFPEWSEALAELLRRVYGGRSLRRNHPDEFRLIHALEGIRDRLRRQASPAGERLAPHITAGEALLLLLEGLTGQPLPAPAGEPAVELLGWLELHLDDAPALVVTGFNEGAIPASVHGDAFLPDQLRRELGLLDNRRRYARDAAVLHAKLGNCRLTLVAGRVSERGDPLTPSRLLFAGAGDATLVRRALAYYRPESDVRPGRPFFAPGEESLFTVPAPTPQSESIRVIGVTAFRTYLRCPYRFYLQHVLKLEELDDRALEMDARVFGILCHEVLSAFGKSDARNSDLTGTIETFLQEELERQALRLLGQHRSPTVELQLHQLRRRFRQFARWQAAEVAQGWRLQPELSEAKVQTDLKLPEQPSGSIIVTGRIDRVDFHQDTGAARLVDYKTADSPRTPDEAHRRGSGGAKQWIDLQLPLYVLLAPKLGVECEELMLGYVNLSKHPEVTFSRAEWSAEELEAAHEQARLVAGRIIRGEFWPPTEPDPRRPADFAALCLDRSAGRPSLLRLSSERSAATSEPATAPGE